MSVYVDDMYLTPMGQYGRMKMSHMMADSLDELHEMADKIGIKRKWFQGDHYDICLSKRHEAVAHGAVEITMREMVVVKRRFHERGKEDGSCNVERQD